MDQVKDDDSCGYGEKWSDPFHISHVEPLIYTDALIGLTE